MVFLVNKHYVPPFPFWWESAIRYTFIENYFQRSANNFLQIFNIRMLIISWLCALFGSNVLLLENLIVDRRFPVKQWSLEFSLLSLLIREHWQKWNCSFSVCWSLSVLLRWTLYVLIFLRINNFILVLNHGGSFLSHTINSWGIKLLRIFKTVLLKVKIFISSFLFSKALSQLNWLIALLIKSSFESL